MIRLAYLIDTIACDTSGTERQLLETIRRLDKNFFDVKLICLWQSKWMAENELPCPCCILNYRGFIKPSFPGVIKRLAQFIKKNKIQIVQTFFQDALFVAWLTSFFVKPTPVLLSSRRDIGLGIHNLPWYHRLYDLILPLVNKRFAGIIANSNKIKKYMARHERVPVDKIIVIPNGIDLPFKKSLPPPVFSIGEKCVWIVITASLSPVKRHDLFLKALAEIKQRDKTINFRAILLGDGPQRKKIERLTEDLDLVNYIHFEGAVKNVAAYLQHSDIGVLCSDREGLSNAIIEYMAHGLPVVATAVGGNVELVDATNGFYVPPGDHRALANALLKLLKNKELRKSLGEKSLQKVKAAYSWKKTMEQCATCYQSIFETA